MKNKKTLLVVTPYFPPDGGGLERYALQIAERLNKDYSWKIIFLASGKLRGKDDKYLYEGIEVYQLSYDFKISNTPFSFNWFTKIPKILKEVKPDVINIHTPVPGIGNLAAMSAGNIPVVVTYHAGSMKKGNILTDIPVWIYEKLILPGMLNQASKIICSSDFLRFGFLNKYQNKSETITPGINTKIFTPNIKMKKSRPTILFVAGLGKSEQYKGLQTLINIAKRLHNKIPDLVLNIVGEGDMKYVYEEQVKKLNLQTSIIFKGKLTGKDLIHEYQKANIFLSPSINESFGMAILEAMSCGIPVVAFDIGGVPTLVENNQNGFLIKNGDIKKFTNKIIQLLNNKKLINKLGHHARHKAIVSFDWELRTKSYDQILSKLRASKPNIVQIVPYYPPHMGGMEIVAQELSEKLSKDDFPTRIFTSNIGAGNLKGKEIKPSLTIERLNSFEFAHIPFTPELLFKLLFLPKNSIFHVHIAQAGWPEVAMVIAKIRHFPVIAHFHLDVGPSGFFGNIFLLYKRLLLGRTLRTANKVIVFSKKQLEVVHKIYSVKRDNLVIIPNGVNDNFFEIHKRNSRKENLRLLYVGRLAIQKRVDRLIDAMSLINVPTHLSIVGDGEDRKELENRVKKLHIKNVTFEGRKSGKELQNFYNNSDAFVIASDKEGMPLVVLEAMASGLPIIGSDVIGIKELVKNTGILVKNPSGGNFAKAIGSLNKNPVLLSRLSIQSLNKARQYSWGKIITKFEKCYSEIRN